MLETTTDNTKASPAPKQDLGVPPERERATTLNPVWQSLALRAGAVPPELTVSQPGDLHEREADQSADRIMRMPESQATPLSGFSEDQTVAGRVSHSAGEPLDQSTRSFMEPRLGLDLSQVRTHTGGDAARVCQKFNAQAFTHHQDIYFGAGRSPGTDALTAHELTHVVQQTSATSERQAPSIQRKLELRPPGKGEASAFDRAQELVDRLNTINPAIQYELKGQSLVYTVKDADEAALNNFDKVMKGFMDRGDVVPMRLITAKGYVGRGPLFADDFQSGYVDLDDLMADDLYSFQSDLLHFLTERFQVKNYERRIGTNLEPQFKKAHQAGKEAEAANLRDLFNDPSIVFNYEQYDREPWVNAFKSMDHGYRVFQVVHHREREVAGGKMWVQKKDGTRVSMEDFRKERAAAK